MVYTALILVLFAASFVGFGGLVLMEVRLSRREQRWLERVSR
jgi:hypothetical protein